MRKASAAKFHKQAAGAEFEMGVLSISMNLESNAIRNFTGAATNATEDEIRTF